MGWTYGLKSKPDPYTIMPLWLLEIGLNIISKTKNKDIPQCLVAQPEQVLHILSRPLQWPCNNVHQQLTEQEQKEPTSRNINVIDHKMQPYVYPYTWKLTYHIHVTALHQRVWQENLSNVCQGIASSKELCNQGKDFILTHPPHEAPILCIKDGVEQDLYNCLLCVLVWSGTKQNHKTLEWQRDWILHNSVN